MTRGWAWVLGGLALATMACGLILNLAPPPDEDGGFGTVAEGGPDAPPMCAPLGGLDGATYLPMTPVDATVWELFDMRALPGKDSAFSGGAFDGRYVYYATRGSWVVRFDTQGTGFGQASAWSSFNVAAAPLDNQGEFAGAVFDGKYVYFIPGSSTASAVARYDTAGPFNVVSSWSSFDTSTLAPGGTDAGLGGYAGGAFDGRNLYVVPHYYEGEPTSRVLRYDTLTRDSGLVDAAADGEAGAPDAARGFVDPSEWQNFDLSGVNSNAAGYAGAVYDGTWVYFAPQYNDAYNGLLHGGASSLAARVRVDGGFTATSSWSTYDLSNVSGNAANFYGAGFDGRYVYFAPQISGVVLRYDTTGTFAPPGGGPTPGWSVYDVTRILPATDAANFIRYSGVGFDGRFVYFVPSGPGFASLMRYDTQSTFTADCAWSFVDLGVLNLDGSAPQQLAGAVFDGQYLYLVPNNDGIAVRFKAKTPPSMPALPGFHGSFF